MFYVFARHCLGTYIYKEKENYASRPLYPSDKSSIGIATNVCPPPSTYASQNLKLKSVINFQKLFNLSQSSFLLFNIPNTIRRCILKYFIFLFWFFLGKKLFQH